MKNIAVTVIVQGSFKNVVIPKDMLSELALKLREEGKYFIHTTKESYEIEGVVIPAKGSKYRLMVLPDSDE